MASVLEVKLPWLQREGFALKNIDFTVENGYLTAVFGINGAGKSTLLSGLTGLLPLPEDAEVTIAGYSLKDEEKKAKDCIGFVFDDIPFELGISVRLAGEMYGKYYSEWEREVFFRYLDRFEIPKGRLLRKLSKGMQMKFQLAFALSHHAKLLVMDEPTASLDPVFRDEFTSVLREVLLDESCGMLISSQLVSEMEVQADYSLLLSKGEQIFFEKTEELLDRYLIVRGREDLFPYIKSRLLGTRKSEFSMEGLLRNDGEPMKLSLSCERPNIEDILYYIKAGVLKRELESNQERRIK